MVTTKIFSNTTTEDVNILGVGVIPAGEQISVTSDGHAPVNLLNFPGVVELVEQETLAAAEVPVEPVASPVVPIKVENGESNDL